MSGAPGAGDPTADPGSQSDVRELLLAAHRLIRSLRQAMPQHTIQPTQLTVLSVLVDCGPCRISTIAQRIPSSQPTATSVVAGLEQRGLVARDPDPADGRAVRVSVTDAGAEALTSAAQSQAGALAERIDGLPEPDRERLGDITRVLRALSEPREPNEHSEPREPSEPNDSGQRDGERG